MLSEVPWREGDEMDDMRIQFSPENPADYYGEKPKRHEERRYCARCGGKLEAYNGSDEHRNPAVCNLTLKENGGPIPRPVEEEPLEAQASE